MSAGAQAQSNGALDCISTMATSACVQAEALLERASDASLFSTTNDATAYVSGVRLELGAGVSGTFANGAGTSFTPGASHGRLPGGSTAGLASDFALGSDTRGAPGNGIPIDEAAISGGFAAGALEAGAHARPLLNGRRESLTTPKAVAEPQTYMLMLAGLGVMGLVARRLRST